MHPFDKSLRIRNSRAVPRPSGPSLRMPVHIENHHVHRYLIAFHIVYYLHELFTGITLVFAVPVAQNVKRRHGLASSYFNEIAQCFFVLMAVAQEIPIDGILIHRLCQPLYPIVTLIKSKCGGAIPPSGSRRLINDTPSGPREQAILQLGSLVVANLSV